MAHLTVARAHERTETVKGSSFIARVVPVKSLAEVEAALAEVRRAHAGASHHCFAYRLGGSVRFSDDGEPGGTAGRPMLELLDLRNLDCVLAVVTRYFGGTKLGAGGLVRAYRGSLAKALDEAGTREVLDVARLRFEVAFADMDVVHRLLDAWPRLGKLEPGYSAAGLQLQVEALERDLPALRDALVAATRGSVRFLDVANEDQGGA